MYKVFIENRPIFFIENYQKEVNCHSIDDSEINSIELDLIPVIRKMPKGTTICIRCKHAKESMDRLFQNYDKVLAAGGIVRRKNKLLFIKRNGFWDIPKGKLEVEESHEEGALREVEEECGISGMSIQSQLKDTFHTYDYRGTPTIKQTFWYAMDYSGPKEVKGQIEEGITKVKWFKKDELEKVKANTFLSIVDVLNDYLEHFPLD